jgi:hypothetical protein
LNLLFQALTRKADAVQRDFGAMGEELQLLGRRLVNAPPGETGPLLGEQAALRERQQALAGQINLWRDRARAALRQPDDASLQAFLNDMEAASDPATDGGVLGAVQTTREFLAHPEQAAALIASAAAAVATPAGRLLQRARTDPALRAEDPASRQREAVEFANRPGLAQNDQALGELEAGRADPDPPVADLAALTLIQCHRFRALRLGELEPAHQSVRWLARLKHRAAIPALIEVLETPRSGYVPGETGPVEATNRRSRLVALAALVEWRTAPAQAAVRARQFDRDPQMAAAAERALTLFPGDWP